MRCSPQAEKEAEKARQKAEKEAEKARKAEEAQLKKEQEELKAKGFHNKKALDRARNTMMVRALAGADCLLMLYHIVAELNAVQ